MHDRLVTLLAKAAAQLAFSKGADGKSMADAVIDRLGYRSQFEAAKLRAEQGAVSLSAQVTNRLTRPFTADPQEEEKKRLSHVAQNRQLESDARRKLLSGIDAERESMVFKGVNNAGVLVGGARITCTRSDIVCSAAHDLDFSNDIKTDLFGVLFQSSACAERPDSQLTGSEYSVVFDRTIQVRWFQLHVRDFISTSATLRFADNHVNSFTTGNPTTCQIEIPSLLTIDGREPCAYRGDACAVAVLARNLRDGATP